MYDIEKEIIYATCPRLLVRVAYVYARLTLENYDAQYNNIILYIRI